MKIAAGLCLAEDPCAFFEHLSALCAVKLSKNAQAHVSCSRITPGESHA
jgi:hypothetical protein